MKTSAKMRLTASVLAIGVTMAMTLAAPAQPSSTAIGVWTVSTQPAGGSFHCLMAQGSPDTGRLFLGIDENGAMLVGFDHPQRIEPGQAARINIFIDSQPVDLTPLRAQFASPTALVFYGLFDLKAPDGMTPLLEAGQQLDYRNANFARHFDLGGLKQAVEQLRSCDERARLGTAIIGQPLHPAPGQPADPGEDEARPASPSG